MAKSKEKDKPFSLMSLPAYEYHEGLACPECYAPVGRGRLDGRCDKCQRDKKVLPVNYIKPVKKKTDDEDEDDFSTYITEVSD